MCNVYWERTEGTQRRLPLWKAKLPRGGSMPAGSCRRHRTSQGSPCNRKAVPSRGGCLVPCLESWHQAQPSPCLLVFLRLSHVACAEICHTGAIGLWTLPSSCLVRISMRPWRVCSAMQTDEREPWHRMQNNFDTVPACTVSTQESGCVD